MSDRDIIEQVYTIALGGIDKASRRIRRIITAYIGEIRAKGLQEINARERERQKLIGRRA